MPDPLRGVVAVGIALAEPAPHPLGSLREYLEGVPVRAPHPGKDLINEAVRHILMEQIRHRVNEDTTRLLPVQRQIQPVREELHLRIGQVILRCRLRHRAALPGDVALVVELKSVAVIAARRDASATRRRVPRSIRPRNCRMIAHSTRSPS